MNGWLKDGGIARVQTLRVIATRILVFAVLWLVVSEGQGGYPLVAAAIVVLSAGVSLILLPPGDLSFSLRGLASFAPYFALKAVSGGLDVAGRALRPSLPIEPAFVEIELRGQSEASRVITADAMSVLPGTLSARLDGSTLTLHILDRGLPYETQVREIERRAERVVRPRSTSRR
jgi:multicomponent Na+:H+ antiporter subunit E